MIKINKTNRSNIPLVLVTKGKLETEKLKTEFDNGSIDFDFKSSIYGNSEVKQELIKLQHGKCCFCESEITAIAYGDVEHYRPKGGWVQDVELLNTPGYYWLAYDWENLFLACQICNQQFKKNYFPLTTTTTRAVNHNFDINNEDALIIHPANENPEDFIEFDKYEPKPVNNNIRGKVTIEKLGLDRDVLNEKRRKSLNSMSLIVSLANGVPNTNNDLKAEFKQFIVEAQKDSGEYASMYRSFFKNNPIAF